GGMWAGKGGGMAGGGEGGKRAGAKSRLCRRSYSRAISEEFAPRIGTRGASLNSRSAQTGEGLSTSRHSTCTDKYPLLWGKADSVLYAVLSAFWGVKSPRRRSGIGQTRRGAFGKVRNVVVPWGRSWPLEADTSAPRP